MARSKAKRASSIIYWLCQDLDVPSPHTHACVTRLSLARACNIRGARDNRAPGERQYLIYRRRDQRSVVIDRPSVVPRLRTARPDGRWGPESATAPGGETRARRLYALRAQSRFSITTELLTRLYTGLTNAALHGQLRGSRRLLTPESPMKTLPAGGEMARPEIKAARTRDAV